MLRRSASTTARRGLWPGAAALFIFCGGWGSRSAEANAPFLRGEVRVDGVLNIADALRLLVTLFPGDAAPTPLECAKAADMDDDGALTLTDAIYLLQYLFLGGPPPGPPSYCGADPTPDALTCSSFDDCTGSGNNFAGLTTGSGGVFVVLDRSANMQGNGEFDVAKRETVRLLSELEPEAATPFGVVASDKTTVAFPPSLVPATSDDSAAVTGAIGFAASLTGGTAESCPDGALLAALELVEASCTAENVIFYAGAGGGNCGGVVEAVYLDATLNLVAQRNTKHAVIHTIALGSGTFTDVRERFLRRLAEQSGGSFIKITR
jgi:hypothetical protein